MSDPTLEQAQNEIAALQRRLAEYASENQRLREQGRECYVDADAKSLLNALEECRTQLAKLKEGGKQIAEAIHMYVHEHGPADCLICYDRMKLALAKARELGLLEDK